MREIKFRAYKKNENRMMAGIVNLYNYPLHCKSEILYFETEGETPIDDIKEFKTWDHADPDDEIILMQYTGLKDKNGKEIYEGDITNNGVVEWCKSLNWDSGGSNHPGFYFDCKETDELSYHDGFDNDTEVIGNIYENPELLKK